VALTAEQRRRIGLKTAVAGSGEIALTRAFPGEVILDPDRTVHVVPRAAGIVREVKKTLGDRVKAGDILAWIESDELAEAKLDFYAKQSEVGCCAVNLPRAKEIFENTHKLLALLKKEPGQKELRKLDGLEMGEYRGKLVTAYAEYRAAKRTYERERSLRRKAISSEKELDEAEATYKKAQAKFVAAKDIARFEVLVAYGEAARAQQVAEFEAVAAEQRLRQKGADSDLVKRLVALVPETASLKPCLCDDPNCRDGEVPSVAKTLGKDARFAWYALRAPSAGIITEKHLTLGEKATDEESVFTITDTSAVWVRFNVYQKDLTSVKPGLAVRVGLGAGAKARTGAISYISPLIDEATRTVPARVVLDNADGSLRPGSYVTVRVDTQAVKAAVVVPRSAVQVLDEKNVVFVQEGDGFEAVRVKLGAGDRERVAVTDGLKPGQRYVTSGGFELKAKIATSGLGAHAGHGH